MTDGNRTNPLLLILAVIGVIAVLGWLGMSLTPGSMMARKRA
jgi:predicted PurR-regulated permease PerM